MRTTDDLSATMNENETEMVYRDAIQVAQDRYWGPGGQNSTNLATLGTLWREYRARYLLSERVAGYRKCANAVTLEITASDFPSSYGGEVVGI